RLDEQPAPDTNLDRQLAAIRRELDGSPTPGQAGGAVRRPRPLGLLPGAGTQTIRRTPAQPARPATPPDADGGGEDSGTRGRRAARPGGSGARDDSGGRVPPLPLVLGIGDPTRYRPEAVWARFESRPAMAVPIGVAPNGVPVEVNLDGLHGLIVGASGSGKTEL